MTHGSAEESRSDALDVYLARQARQGFHIETRSGIQAVIVRRHRLHFALRWFARKQAEQRLVVWVDEHGHVEQRAAEPLRW